MLEILLVFVLTHHNDGSPYGWHIDCERFLQRKTEILMDKNLDFTSKNNLINYLRTKVKDRCTQTLV